MTDFINAPPLNAALPVQEGVARWPAPWGNWFTKAQLVLFASSQSGVTGNRPTRNLWAGRIYWDTTLALPIFWDAAAAVWVNAAGVPV